MLAQDVSCQTAKCLWVEEIYQGQWQHGSFDQRLGSGRLQTANIDKVQDVTSICLLVIFTTLELEYSQLHCLKYSIKQAGFSENNERKQNIFSRQCRGCQLMWVGQKLQLEYDNSTTLKLYISVQWNVFKWHTRDSNFITAFNVGFCHLCEVAAKVQMPKFTNHTHALDVNCCSKQTKRSDSRRQCPDKVSRQLDFCLFSRNIHVYWMLISY